MSAPEDTDFAEDYRTAGGLVDDGWLLSGRASELLRDGLLTSDESMQMESAADEAARAGEEIQRLFVTAAARMTNPRKDEKP